MPEIELGAASASPFPRWPTRARLISVTTDTSPAPAAPAKTFFGQPRLLANLFGVEMWERFSFYGMQGILLIYLYYSVDAGRPRHRPGDGHQHRGRVRRAGLSLHHPRRVARGPAGRPGADAVLRRLPRDARSHLARPAARADRGRGRPGLYRGRQRRGQGQRHLTGRHSVHPAGPAPRRRLLDLLSRHQPRRLPRAAPHRAAAVHPRLPLGLRAGGGRDGDRTDPVLDRPQELHRRGPRRGRTRSPASSGRSRSSSLPLRRW